MFCLTLGFQSAMDIKPPPGREEKDLESLEGCRVHITKQLNWFESDIQ